MSDEMKIIVQGPFDCGTTKFPWKKVQRHNPVVVNQEVSVIEEPIVAVNPNINLNETSENTQSHEIKKTKDSDNKILVLEFSGYVTDGDHILVIRDIENGKITKNIEINKGHQFSSTPLTINQIMKIYGFLESQGLESSFIKKQNDESYHFSSDDNLVVCSGKNKVKLSELPNYENSELLKSLEDKFGNYEEKYKIRDDYERKGQILPFDEYYNSHGAYSETELQKQIIIEAKKVYETFKTSKAIYKFSEKEFPEGVDETIKYFDTEQKIIDTKKLQSLIKAEHSTYDTTVLPSIVITAAKYADYVEEQANKKLNKSKLAKLRNKLAKKVDNALGTHLEEKKIAKPLKKIEKAVSDKLFGKVNE